MHYTAIQDSAISVLPSWKLSGEGILANKAQGPRAFKPIFQPQGNSCRNGNMPFFSWTNVKLLVLASLLDILAFGYHVRN